jgi:hypothetical protein
MTMTLAMYGGQMSSRGPCPTVISPSLGTEQRSRWRWERDGKRRCYAGAADGRGKREGRWASASGVTSDRRGEMGGAPQSLTLAKRMEHGWEEGGERERF